MKSERNIHFVASLSLLVTLVLLPTATWAQRPEMPQRPEFPRRLLGLEPEVRTLQSEQEATSDPEATVYVETFGSDNSRCGPQRRPCQTINYGLYRAQQLREDPLVWDGDEENLATVRIGPGEYEERVVVTADYIRLVGSGPGSTTIIGERQPDESGYAVQVFGNKVYLEDLTFSGGDIGLWVRNEGHGIVRNCSFVDNLYGFAVSMGSAFLYSSSFSNNDVGAAATSNSRLYLQDVTLTGKGVQYGGSGIVVGTGAAVSIDSSDPGNPSGISGFEAGIEMWGNCIMWISDAQIMGNAYGMAVFGNAYATLNQSTISDNSVFGIWVVQASVLSANNVTVSGNGIFGVYLTDFSHGVLRNMTFSNNGAGADHVYSEPGTGSSALIRP